MFVDNEYNLHFRIVRRWDDGWFWYDGCKLWIWGLYTLLIIFYLWHDLFFTVWVWTSLVRVPWIVLHSHINFILIAVAHRVLLWYLYHPSIHIFWSKAKIHRSCALFFCSKILFQFHPKEIICTMLVLQDGYLSADEDDLVKWPTVTLNTKS